MAHRSPPPEPESPPEEAPRKPGRPVRGQGAVMYNVSLQRDVRDWLRDHPDGPAAVADRVLRREMERERRKAGK